MRRNRSAARPTTIADALCAIDNPRTMQQFLEEILTPAEQDDLNLRWRLMGLLSSGMSQRKIAAELGISLCKITRGSRIIRDNNSIAATLLAQQ